MSRIISDTSNIHVGCMNIKSNGVVGLHQAPIPQVLLVIDGEGIVKSNEEKEYSISAGYAAYWEQDEWHETKTENYTIVTHCRGDII